MRVLILSLLVLAPPSCMTPPKPREATKKIISTSKPGPAALTDTARALMSAGYRTKTIDREIGMLTTEPKEFPIARGVLKAQDQARSSVQLLTVPQGLELQIVHECRYSMGSPMTPLQTMHDAGFSVCKADDYAANQVLPAKDEEISKIVRDALK